MRHLRNSPIENKCEIASLSTLKKLSKYLARNVIISETLGWREVTAREAGACECEAVGSKRRLIRWRNMMPNFRQAARVCNGTAARRRG
jgi:hypothetical protein